MSDIYEKQILTDASVEMQGVKPDASPAAAIAAAGEKMHALARNTYAAALHNDMAKQLSAAYTAHENDPTSLDSAFGEIRAGMIKTIEDSDVATAFMTDFDLKASSYLAAAQHKFRAGQRKEHKSALNDAMADNIEELTQTATGIFSVDDDDLKVGFAHARQSIGDALMAKNDIGANVFTDSERLRGEKNISRAALVGLQNFLVDPENDPMRVQEIISRFNKGDYKDMFSADDYPKAMRLLKAAARQIERGGSGDNKKGEDDTVAGARLQIELDGFKADSKDKEYAGADMQTMLGFRNRILEAADKGQITQKETKDLMSKSAPAMLSHIEGYIAAPKGTWWGLREEKPTHQALGYLKQLADNAGIGADQRLFLYEDFLNRYSAAGGTDERSEEELISAQKVAQSVVRDMARSMYPMYDPKKSSAIVMGRTIVDFGATRKPVSGNFRDFELPDTPQGKSDSASGAVKSLWGK